MAEENPNTKLNNIHAFIETKVKEYDAINANDKHYSAPGKHEIYISIMLGIDRYRLQKNLETGNSEYNGEHKKIVLRGEYIIKEYEAMRLNAFLAVPR